VCLQGKICTATIKALTAGAAWAMLKSTNYYSWWGKQECYCFYFLWPLVMVCQWMVTTDSICVQIRSYQEIVWLLRHWDFGRLHDKNEIGEARNVYTSKSPPATWCNGVSAVCPADAIRHQAKAIDSDTWGCNQVYEPLSGVTGIQPWVELEQYLESGYYSTFPGSNAKSSVR
jgi:hypothetical protein